MVDDFDFEDTDYDLSYCEGDPTLDDVDPVKLNMLSAKQMSISLHPREDHQDLASVCLLVEMYGDDLVVL